MFFDDYNKPKRGRPRFTMSDFAQGIMYTVLAIFCLVFFRGGWIFSLAFALCAVFRFWHHSKMKKNKAALKKIMKEYGDEDCDDDDEDEDKLLPIQSRKLSMSNLTRKERKARYKEFLNEIEDEFADFDIED